MVDVELQRVKIVVDREEAVALRQEILQRAVDGRVRFPERPITRRKFRRRRTRRRAAAVV
jgi:hypothetical protein